MSFPITVREPLKEVCRTQGIPVLTDELLSRHTTFRIGGPAALCICPQTKAQLVQALDDWRIYGQNCSLTVIGKGSNLLVSDEGYNGICVLTDAVNRVTFKDGGAVIAECGTSLTALSKACVQNGRTLAGLAFADGIPGSVGGAVVMNAGAYGGQMSDTVASSTYYDLQTGMIHTVSAEAHQFAYRHSLYTEHPSFILLETELQLTGGEANQIRAEMERNVAARKAKQPLRYPSAGSVFKRPAIPDVYVGRMVEACGLKGYSIGDAQVSELHGGFIVNRGNATCEEVKSVIQHVKKVIANRYGIQLECEIRYLSNGGETL